MVLAMILERELCRSSNCCLSAAESKIRLGWMIHKLCDGVRGTDIGS